MKRRVDNWVIGCVAALFVAAGSGCVTGERPTLASNATTGFADVDELLGRVAGLNDAEYSAGYDVLVRYGDRTTTATASQSAGDRRSLTVGDVRYVVHGAITKTCTISTGSCQGVIDASRVSDVQMTPDFFGTSLSAQIALDAGRTTGLPVSSVEATEGGEALCVAIPISDSTSTYCVLDNGVLTRLDTAALQVTMTSYSDEVDETLYQESAPSTSAASTTTTATTTSTTTTSTSTTTTTG